ncbi:IS3 family transposase [Kineococcus sp. SYSU DK003]|uniref:IS3 family transposase n=1 Tax=Kineococcus sp. SYSU DK003 TaxID=3383124 RepID=UPI003D7EC1E4
MINPAVDELASTLAGRLGGIRRACALLGRARASHYRANKPPRLGPSRPRPRPASALSRAEEQQVLDLVTSDRFVDKSVAQIWAMLLDEGTYLCSQSTIHRLLRRNGIVGDRRAQATHPARVKPELVAVKVGQVWTWDITKLRGPARGVYYELYVVIDIFSRFVVAWRVEAREDAGLAQDMLEQAMGRHQIPDVVHADRGTSMTSKPVAQLLVDLGVTRSHSRPRVSNDNPFSEAQFKTLKYAPAFPDRFESLDRAREFCEVFFAHYNYEHRHSGIGLHTPASVHYGTVGQIRAARQMTLDAAYAAHPERFATRRPTPPALPTSAWINQPSREAQIQSV